MSAPNYHSVGANKSEGSGRPLHPSLSKSELMREKQAMESRLKALAAELQLRMEQTEKERKQRVKIEQENAQLRQRLKVLKKRLQEEEALMGGPEAVDRLLRATDETQRRRAPAVRTFDHAGTSRPTEDSGQRMSNNPQQGNNGNGSRSNPLSSENVHSGSNQTSEHRCKGASVSSNVSEAELKQVGEILWFRIVKGPGSMDEKRAKLMEALSAYVSKKAIAGGRGPFLEVVTELLVPRFPSPCLVVAKWQEVQRSEVEQEAVEAYFQSLARIARVVQVRRGPESVCFLVCAEDPEAADLLMREQSNHTLFLQGEALVLQVFTSRSSLLTEIACAPAQADLKNGEVFQIELLTQS